MLCRCWSAGDARERTRFERRGTKDANVKNLNMPISIQARLSAASAKLQGAYAGRAGDLSLSVPATRANVEDRKARMNYSTFTHLRSVRCASDLN
jgi:hypothetical protein